MHLSRDGNLVNLELEYKKSREQLYGYGEFYSWGASYDSSEWTIPKDVKQVTILPKMQC